MAKLNKAKGKQPVSAPHQRLPDHAENDDDLRDRLTRQAQTLVKKNRASKTHVTVEYDAESDEDNATNMAVGRMTRKSHNLDDNGNYPLEAEEADWEAHLADREASLWELQDELEQVRAEHAALQQRKKAAAHSTSAPKLSRSKATSVRTSAQGAASAPSNAPAAAPALAPTPAAAPANIPPTQSCGPPPLVFEGAPKWIPLPQNKLEQTIAKIRCGLGVQKNSDWLAIQDVVRQTITRSGLDINKKWKHQDLMKLVLLYPIIENRIPGLKNFEEKWATARLVQTKFNNRRGHQRETKRQDREQEIAAALTAEQMDLDDPGLHHFGMEPEQPPEPEPEPQDYAQAVSSCHVSTSRDWRTAVPTGAPAVDLAPTQASPHAHAPVLACVPTHAADAPSADPAPLAKPKGKARPKMQLPPPEDDELFPDAPFNIAAASPSRSPQRTSSGAGALAPVPTQHMPRSQAPTDDQTAKKRSATEARLEREPAQKKPRPSKQPQAAPAVADPSVSPVDTAGTAAPGPATRQSSLRASKAAAAAAVAMKRTNAARKKLPIQETPQKKGKGNRKGKGKKPASPASTLSGSLEPESDDPSVNDDGFHPLGEDE